MINNTNNKKYYTKKICNKHSYFDKIPREIKEKIFSYITYYDLLNLRIINKKFYELLRIYLEKYFIEKRFIESIPRINKQEDIIKRIINESFSTFPIKTFKLHKYDYKFNFNGKNLCLILSFTYFNNNHYHNIQLVGDNDDIFKYIIHGILEGTDYSSSKTKILLTRYDDYYDYNEDKDIKKLSSQMGFENSYLEIYEMFKNINNYYLKTKIDIDEFNRILENIDLNGIMNEITENH